MNGGRVFRWRPWLAAILIAALLVSGYFGWHYEYGRAKGLSATVGDEEVVRTALSQAFASLPSVPAEHQAPILAIGCPRPRFLTGKLADYRQRNFIMGSGPDVPSPYRVFVYFTDRRAYEAAFGSEPYASTSEEFACASSCSAITRAVYVPLGTEIESLRDGLLETLNLLNERQARDLLRRELSPGHTPTALPPSR